MKWQKQITKPVCIIWFPFLGKRENILSYALFHRKIWKAIKQNIKNDYLGVEASSPVSSFLLYYLLAIIMYQFHNQVKPNPKREAVSVVERGAWAGPGGGGCCGGAAFADQPCWGGHHSCLVWFTELHPAECKLQSPFPLTGHRPGQAILPLESLGSAQVGSQKSAVRPTVRVEQRKTTVEAIAEPEPMHHRAGKDWLPVPSAGYLLRRCVFQNRYARRQASCEGSRGKLQGL